MVRLRQLGRWHVGLPTKLGVAASMPCRGCSNVGELHIAHAGYPPRGMLRPRSRGLWYRRTLKHLQSGKTNPSPILRAAHSHYCLVTLSSNQSINRREGRRWRHLHFCHRRIERRSQWKWRWVSRESSNRELGRLKVAAGCRSCFENFFLPIF